MIFENFVLNNSLNTRNKFIILNDFVLIFISPGGSIITSREMPGVPFFLWKRTLIDSIVMWLFSVVSTYICSLLEDENAKEDWRETIERSNIAQEQTIRTIAWHIFFVRPTHVVREGTLPLCTSRKHTSVGKNLSRFFSTIYIVK